MRISLLAVDYIHIYLADGVYWCEWLGDIIFSEETNAGRPWCGKCKNILGGFNVELLPQTIANASNKSNRSIGINYVPRPWGSGQSFKVS